MPLFASRIYVPSQVWMKIPKGVFKMHYTAHSIERFRGRRVAELPKEVNMIHCQVLEIETDMRGEITKLLIRKRHTDRYDLVAAVIPKGQDFAVKTVWENERNDKKATLETSRYVKNEKEYHEINKPLQAFSSGNNG